MFYYLCRIINVTASLLYPTYASYKALKSSSSSSSTDTSSGSQVSVSELERWSMYWCIIAIVWAFQDWIEWSVSWFPFYFELKTFIILWLVLPQIQGSTYLYRFHLSPFLSSHEHDIDQFLTSSSSRLRSLGASYLSRLLHSIRDTLLGTTTSTTQLDASSTGAGGEGEGLRGLVSNHQWFNQANALNALATGYATLRPISQQQEEPRTFEEAREKEKRSTERLRRKERLRRELEELSSSASNSSEDEEEPSSSPAGYSSSSSSNLTHAKLRRGVPSSLSPGQGSGRDPVAKRYVESQLGGESVFEEVGGEEELKGYPPISPGGKGAGEGAKNGADQGGGGWFGWGSGGGAGGAKGKQEKGKGKKE